MNTLLSGIVGSTAYGLTRPGSDVDRLGVYAVDTVELHGLRAPNETHVEKAPDLTMHEVGKYCRLALNGNPTVMELLWLPEDLHEVVTPIGYELIDLRSAFLSAQRVRNAYFGYAVQQFRKLESRGDGTFSPDLAKRTAKHARHMYRLLMQGLELWRAGTLTIQVSNPADVLDFGEQVAAGDIAPARMLLRLYEERFNENPTVLPDEPDEQAVESWLRKVRAEFYTA